MATYEEYMNAARNADAAGDEAAARQLVQSALALKRQGNQPEADMSFMGRVKDNFIGTDDGVDSWGEKAGNMVRGAGAAVARGMADVPAIPANLAQLGAMGVEKALGMEQPSAVSRALDKLPDTRDMLAAVPVIGPESKYKAPGKAGEFISTVGEFAGGAGAAAGPGAMIRYGAVPGLASEAAGQATEGTKYEPWARTGAALGASILATPQPSRYGRGLASIDDDTRKGADYLLDKGIRPTAGQVMDNRKVMKLEGALSATDDQMDAFTRAALSTAGEKLAKRATPEVLRRTQKTIVNGMNDILDIDAPIPSSIGGRVAEVADDYFSGTAGRDMPVALRKIAEQLEDVATSPLPNATIPAGQLRKWRTILGSYTTSSAEMSRDASHALREVIDDITETALTNLGRGDDIAKLGELRTQYRNFLAITDAASKSGRDNARGLLTPNSLNTSIKKIVGKTNAATGRGTELANLTRKAEANIGPVSTVDPGGIRDVLNTSLASAGYGVGGASAANMAGLSGPAALGVGVGAAALPFAARKFVQSGLPQSALMDARNIGRPFIGSGAGILGSILNEQ